MRWWRLASGVVGILLVSAVFLGSALATDSKPPAVAAANARYTAKLVLEGREVGVLESVSGLESEHEVVEVIEFRNGDDPVTHKRPGKAKYKNIVLRIDATGDRTLLDWFRKVQAGQTERKSGSIIYLDREGKEVLRYNFFEAWPCRWKGPELNAGTDVIVEEIEFVVEKVERA